MERSKVKLKKSTYELKKQLEKSLGPLCKYIFPTDTRAFNKLSKVFEDIERSLIGSFSQTIMSGFTAKGAKLTNLGQLMGYRRETRGQYAKGFNWHKKKKAWIEKDSSFRRRLLFGRNGVNCRSYLITGADNEN